MSTALADMAENMIRNLHALKFSEYRNEPELYDAVAHIIDVSVNIEVRRGNITEDERDGILSRLHDTYPGYKAGPVH